MGARTTAGRGGDAIRPENPERARQGTAGRIVVSTMVALGVVLATYGVVHQRRQTRRCLDFFGVVSARHIASARRVTLSRLRPGDRAGVLEGLSRSEISKAPGLVHLRRGLVEDANYAWPSHEPTDGIRDRRATAEPDAVRDPGDRTDRLPPEAWDWAIEFAEALDPADTSTRTVLVVDLPDETSGPGEMGWLAVVGRPGRVALGRLGPGLARWIKETGGLAAGRQGGEDR